MKSIGGPFSLIYAEHREADGSLSQGTFIGLAEFMPYRERGWSSTDEIDKLADQALLDAKHL